MINMQQIVISNSDFIKREHIFTEFLLHSTKFFYGLFALVNQSAFSICIFHIQDGLLLELGTLTNKNRFFFPLKLLQVYRSLIFTLSHLVSQCLYSKIPWTRKIKCILEMILNHKIYVFSINSDVQSNSELIIRQHCKYKM